MFRFVSFRFAVPPSSAYLFTAGVEVVYLHVITLRHTPQSVGLLCTRDRPVAETSNWQYKHSQETNIHAPVRFEPTVPASTRPQTYALDRAATGIVCKKYSNHILEFQLYALNKYKFNVIMTSQTQTTECGTVKLVLPLTSRAPWRSCFERRNMSERWM
jgi:hypothetical protein